MKTKINLFMKFICSLLEKKEDSGKSHNFLLCIINNVGPTTRARRFGISLARQVTASRVS